MGNNNKDNNKDAATLHLNDRNKAYAINRPNTHKLATHSSTNRVVSLADFKPKSLFATPSDEEELQAIIETYPKECRAAIHTIVCMHWNLICKNIRGDL